MNSVEDDPIRRATRPPEGPGGEVSEGGMTGATGELTPESSQVAFIPAERREAASAEHQADVTAAFNREGASLVEADTDAAAEPDPTGEGADATDVARAEAPRGLPSNDPAFRMERHPSASEADEVTGRVKHSVPDAEPRLGGDVRRDPEEEHF
jgi:hypothetical protein